MRGPATPGRPFDTERLTFRSWAVQDDALAIALWGDPRVMALIDASAAGPEAARARLAAEIERERTTGVQYWPIFRRDTGEHVGCCGMRPFGDARGEFELGFHLRFEQWGSGYASEAARAVIAFAFLDRDASRLIAGHHPDNATSARTLARLGFRYSHDQLYPPTGREHPYHVLEPPLTVVAFSAGSRLRRDRPVPTTLPLARRVPPATWVVFPDGRGLGIPTDQIVLSDDASGSARVGFGGMRFDGLDDGWLVLRREREIWPEEMLAPERGRTLRVRASDVTRVIVERRAVWP
jgi:RimJ/RimL family protein N-acetyltransferase